MLVLVPTAREARSLFDGGRAPRCEDAVEAELGGRVVRAALCGFGPAAAAALAALTLSRERPERVLLLGVGGSYDAARLPLGGVLRAARVVFGDLGAQCDGLWRGPRELGFEQAPPAAGRPAVGDELELSAPSSFFAGAPAGVAGGLVTVAAASAGAAQAQARRARLTDALLEDMEGWGVALAAARLGVPCAIVRAASNLAGETDRARWDVGAALAALRAWCLSAVASA